MIKKFHATTTRDALRQVRDALGANAIILSNRQVAGGIEIIAVADLDMAALAQHAEPAPMPAATPMTRPDHQFSRPSPAAPVATPRPRREAPPAPPEPPLTTLADYLAQREASVIRPTPARRPTPPMNPLPADTPQPAAWTATQEVAPAPAAQGAEAGSPMMAELAREMRRLRSLVQNQLAGFAWNDVCQRDPQRAEVMRRLLAAGFSPALGRQLLTHLPAEPDPERAMKWIRAALGRQLKIADPVDDLIDRGGIYALVGPTGVGKTTTVAKLAARAVLRHGADRVAMITTDSYRIGAQDQLRIYGRILGTPVFAVRDENDLELTLLDLRSKHLVFIDTIGMSQKDKRVTEQTQMLTLPERPVERLLLLGAPSQGITLEEVVRNYAGAGLAGCILTKIDEALTYGPVLDVAIRHQLAIRYVTNGQRVPEDLHLVNASYLVDRAFRLGKPDPAYTSDEADFPILMAAAEEDPFGENPPREAYGTAG